MSALPLIQFEFSGVMLVFGWNQMLSGTAAAVAAIWQLADVTVWRYLVTGTCEWGCPGIASILEGP